MSLRNDTWEPLQKEKLAAIRLIFNQLFPDRDHGNLAHRISDYWIKMLRDVWQNKSSAIKEKDRRFIPADPLSRIQQKTAVIAYADSLYQHGEATLVTLDRFLKIYFPAVGGLHILPACVVSEDRFNDGYFSQIVRDRIHESFGTNRVFSEMMAKYYSMADFVLNHVDIDHPDFQAYLGGDDERGDCFYVFTEMAYQAHLKRGDFDRIFRPRPFPLFSIFRRKPGDMAFAEMSLGGKVAEMNSRFEGERLPEPVIRLMSIFNKIKNDQMLLDVDYRHIIAFRDYLEDDAAIDPDEIFEISTTQETREVPYIFREKIVTHANLLRAIGYPLEIAEEYASIYQQNDPIIFGEEIRALTTFSHVQVDLNTSTHRGLKLLADDFSWYLGLDLNMLRLDAANFAFKKWQTTCFGLPEAQDLMKILYLSMDVVSPRMVANLEVNDRLGSILAQMSDKTAAPPMMYDFHLASMLPAVFVTGDARILTRILPEISRYDIPKESIRFSLVESHDGKSVRGGFDLLTHAERQILADTVEKNGGKIKYRGVREPYELCISTWDSLPAIDNRELEADRYLAFYTLAFALMGRNVKSIYFNDLLGLTNDYEKIERSGELRDIKRTKSDFGKMVKRLEDPSSIEHKIAHGMNALIALVDADPSLNYRGNESRVNLTSGDTPPDSALVIHNSYEDPALTIINIGPLHEKITINLHDQGLSGSRKWFDNISGHAVSADADNRLSLTMQPFQRLWLTRKKVEIARAVSPYS